MAAVDPPLCAEATALAPALKQSTIIDRIPEDVRRILHRLASDLWGGEVDPGALAVSLLASGSQTHALDCAKLAPFCCDTLMYKCNIHKDQYTCSANCPNSLSLVRVPVFYMVSENLISVRQLTRDNNISIEFDPCGFSVKDLAT